MAVQDSTTSASNHNNPLAAARKAKKSQTGKSAKNASVANAKAERVWHKRSGAGHRLFLEYYAGQPSGVVVTQHSEAEKLPVSASATAAASSSRGKGQSRAALRRKKKRRKTNHHEASNNESSPTSAGNDEPSNNNLPPPPSYQRRDLLYQGRLLDVLEEETAGKSSNSKALASPEFRAFAEALSRPLPLTFRFRRYAERSQTNRDESSSSRQKKRILHTLQSLRKELATELCHSGVRPLPWDSDVYQAVVPPKGSEYPFPLSKPVLSRACPDLKAFLNAHTGDGTVARQELGSMLPVWLLEKVGAFRSSKSVVRVLDTCASPGSKTLQAAELLQLLPSPGGRIRANDVNANRLETLQQALRRSGYFGRTGNDDDDSSSNSNSDDEASRALEDTVRFSNVDASRFPVPSGESKKYHAVLCDVPCSGDGTVRKDVHVVPSWTPAIGSSLHGLQCRILARALRCVRVRGWVSYSTCSLNPVEDEAVVRSVLAGAAAKDSPLSGARFELVEVPEAVRKGLVLRPGVRTWRVADFDPGNRDTEKEDDDDEERPPSLTWYDSYEQARTNGMDGALPSFWPGSEDDAPPLLPLERCLRLFPQDQDSGGFFVALIRRTR